ncbi:hypothetical protein T11_18252 [Trichinella zimbabwensis]|uniref:Uncharacterized protein n=1 Tax=Trichinella zimbabwensis TaxID=268475 RepID=A0A0V1H242_9BILA|nr:hypothetical protein T11_18252 [Trichinella zimbabwensis]
MQKSYSSSFFISRASGYRIFDVSFGVPFVNYPLPSFGVSKGDGDEQ